MAIPISQYQVNPEITELTNQSFERASQAGPQDYAQGMLEGTQIEPNYDLTNTLNDAIARRSRRGYDLGQAKLGAAAERYGQTQNLERVSKVNRLLQDEKRLNDQIAEMKQRAEQDRKRARAGVLGTILGIGGAVAGGAVGGPAGAMAGYQLGSGLGQTAGYETA
jgi:hypothetical protein